MTLKSETTIVLASGNRGKLEELRALLGPGFRVTSAPELDVEMPEETETTFEGNAVLKARAVAERTGSIAIADDSGLEVDALGGEPGVYSARYAGPEADDERNKHKLLTAMQGIPDAERTARFHSAIAIAFSPDDVVTTTGLVEGHIGHEEMGTGGFGYDPLFVLADGRTMAELSSEEKNAISHRGNAMRKAIRLLRERLDVDTVSVEAR